MQLGNLAFFLRQNPTNQRTGRSTGVHQHDLPFDIRSSASHLGVQISDRCHRLPVVKRLTQTSALLWARILVQWAWREPNTMLKSGTYC